MSSLHDLQQRIAATRSERGFTADPVRLLGLLIEEVGEVATEIKKTWSDNYPDLVADDLANELADVLVLVSALASSFDLDLHQAVETKFFGADSERHWATAAQAAPPPVSLHPWPTDFLQKKRGLNCPQCELGRVGETEHGVRYFTGDHADGYLQRSGPTLGYSVVVFRGRHVGDPQSMTPEEHAGFWADVSSVAEAIEAAFGPIHLNFQILGNQDPHVHVHIVPRYDPDPAPSLPLPAVAWEASTELAPSDLATQLDALRTGRAKAR
jgi:diadenosine tetraphosphate (Ap4A) HIT family hydrolase/NTP pyrophosphatase (non-canonical NTP hydrolase)